MRKFYRHAHRIRATFRPSTACACCLRITAPSTLVDLVSVGLVCVLCAKQLEGRVN